MYAVIRAGGKQYRVAPGDVIRVEKTPVTEGRVEFPEVLAVSASDGQIAQPSQARVVGQVVEQGRGDKVLVFHYKRKKQYKKLRGHRQPFTAVRITEIAFDGQSFTAPETARPKKKTESAPPEQVETAEGKTQHEAAPAKAAPRKTSAPKKTAKKAASKKPKK